MSVIRCTIRGLPPRMRSTRPLSAAQRAILQRHVAKDPRVGALDLVGAVALFPLVVRKQRFCAGVCPERKRQPPPESPCGQNADHHPRAGGRPHGMSGVARKQPAALAIGVALSLAEAKSARPQEPLHPSARQLRKQKIRGRALGHHLVAILAFVEAIDEAPAVHCEIEEPVGPCRIQHDPGLLPRQVTLHHEVRHGRMRPIVLPGDVDAQQLAHGAPGSVTSDCPRGRQGVPAVGPFNLGGGRFAGSAHRYDAVTSPDLDRPVARAADSSSVSESCWGSCRV